jgi:hypothetical protein
MSYSDNKRSSFEGLLRPRSTTPLSQQDASSSPAMSQHSEPIWGRYGSVASSPNLSEPTATMLLAAAAAAASNGNNHAGTTAPHRQSPRFNRRNKKSVWLMHGEYDTVDSRGDDDDDGADGHHPAHDKANRSPGTRESSPMGGGGGASLLFQHLRPSPKGSDSGDGSRKAAAGGASPAAFAYYLVYAFVNCIISVPCLYGYAAVIFNHPVFGARMDALSKMVVFSSLLHQLAFTLFSGLPFAIGTVQDAGLIFLSSMSNQIATAILDVDDGTEEEVMSTVLVLLALGTASLGIVLILMGYFQLAK